MTERKAFQDLPGKDNPQFVQEAIKIYEALREKYPNNTIEDSDNILNVLCASLIIVCRTHVAKDDHKNFLQLIWKVLNNNIK